MLKSTIHPYPQLESAFTPGQGALSNRKRVEVFLGFSETNCLNGGGGGRKPRRNANADVPPPINFKKIEVLCFSWSFCFAFPRNLQFVLVLSVDFRIFEPPGNCGGFFLIVINERSHTRTIHPALSEDFNCNRELCEWGWCASPACTPTHTNRRRVEVFLKYSERNV